MTFTELSFEERADPDRFWLTAFFCVRPANRVPVTLTNRYAVSRTDT
jgi:hypothetical protein